MYTRIYKIIIAGLFLLLCACTSNEKSGEINDSDILSDAEVASPPAAGDDFSDDFGDDFGDEEAAFNQAESSEPADDVFSDDEFEQEFAEAENDLGDDSFSDDAFAEEEPLEESPSVFAEPTEEPVAEDPFAEAPIAEDTLTESDFAVDVAEDSNPVTVQSIDFIANQNGGTLQVKTTGVASYNGRFNAETNQYVLEIANASLSPQVKRPYIMKDFQTAFGAVNSYQNPGGSTARIVVQMKNATEPIVQQEGDRILLVSGGSNEMSVATQPNPGPSKEMPPEEDAWKTSYDVTEAEKQEKILGARSLEEFLSGSTKFFGRPISIQVDNAEIQDVINFIADESGVNLVLSDDVKGKISLKLRQIPWDQALVIVMRSKGLGYVRQGSVLRITKLENLQEETKAAQAIVDAQTRLTPLKVKVLPVSYATVTDLEKQVEPFLTPQRGKVVSDTRTSSLIITDTPAVLSRVERLVQELDIPPAQVMIEGKIVEASESFSKTIGVNWGFGGVPTELSSGGGFQGNAISVSPAFRSSQLSDDLASTFNLNIGTLDIFGNLDAQLGLAQSDSLVKVVSSPRIVTMNRIEASISQKGEILTENSVTTGETTTTSIERTPIELNLKVTPQITAEGSVILDVAVKRQFAGSIQNNTRPVNSREAATKILVPNGQTAVIGGIYSSDDSITDKGVPGLKNIPVVGWLFKQKEETRDKNELLIFLTPRILNAKDQSVRN